MTDCYFDSAACLVCPEIPPSPGTPPRIVTDPNLGWNAGANSITVLGGDVYVQDSLDVAPSGMIIGFKTTRANNTDPTQILHGLYFYPVGDAVFADIRERGRLVGAPQHYTLGTPWTIRRVGEEISYWLGNVLLARTRALSLDALLVNACLYAAGDSVP